MKILLVSHFFPTRQGGIETVAARLAEAIVAAHDDCHIDWFASAPAPPVAFPGLRYRPQAAWHGIEKLSELPAPLWGLRSLLDLRKAVSQSDAVHIHDVLYCANLLAAHWAQRFDKPLVITQHVGPIPYRSRLLSGLLSALNRRLVRRVLNRARQVVFISPAVADYFKSFCQFSQLPRYIANGVDCTRFTPDGELLSLPEITTTRARGGRIFLFVGRFVEKKGLPLLRELCRQTPDDFWLFAGRGADDPGHWRFSNVRVLHDLSGTTLAGCYRAADLLVLPSYGEGFPLVVQEAMACGTPALISDTTADGAPDMRQHLHTESLAAPVALTRWQQRLQAFKPYTPTQRMRLASAAQARWSWTQAASEYARIFDASIGTKA